MPTRREFFKKAAALSGSAGLASVLVSSIERASAIDPPEGSTFLDAEHVVILMQENRSFDHCFGKLRGVRGFNDPRAVTQPDGKPVWLQTNSAGETYAPFPLGLRKTSATWLGSLPHSWRDQTDARNGGNHDRWLDSKPSHREDCEGMPLTMGFYDREDLPFYYAFADAFTICDQNFCSSLTGTTPNRLYFWSGTVREKQEAGATPCVRNSEIDNYTLAHWKTFPERLEEAGVSWKVYQNEINLMTGFHEEETSWLANFNDNALEWFAQYKAGFSKTYRRELERLAATLPGEIDELRKGARAADRAKELARKERLLVLVAAERAVWTDEAFGRLSPRELSLHAKAFATNLADPAYRELETLKYDDGGETREMAIPKGDPLHQFRQDVKNGQLPAVSWLVPSERLSDHPSSPWYGAWYVAEALDILTSNPEVWKKTIFVLNYDENDGYFDHVPPFVAPDPEDPASGGCSPGIDTGVEYLRLQQDLARQPAKEARGGPLGLGYRVPLLVASPWSRGGFVCSQVFDHTSVLQLLEKITSHRSGKQIRETNISSWRRTVCGDMTSVFRPFRGDGKPSLKFPAKDSFLEEIHRARFQKPPAGYRKLLPDDIGAFERDRFAVEWMPQQERGVRPSAALPYQLYAEGGVSGDGADFELVLEARNEVFGKASAGAPFHVYAPGGKRTRAYAVGAGQLVKDSWKLENDRYHLRVCGPNGFLREFAGGPGDPRASFRCEYSRRHAGDIEILVNSAGGGLTVHLTDNAYGSGGRTLTVQGGKAQTALFSLVRSHGWYDFSIRIGGQDAFLRRYAGRVETGKAGFSDPFMGRV